MGRPFEQGYRTEDGILLNATRLSGTVIPAVLVRPLFWFALAIHIAVWLCFYYGVLPGRFETAPAWALGWNEVKVITAITTFFQVFYISQCYTRYLKLYTDVRSMLTDMTTILIDLRLRVLPQLPEYAWLASRYVVAAGVMVLQGMAPNGAQLEGASGGCIEAGGGGESDADSDGSADESQSRVLVAKNFETPRSARSRITATPRGQLEILKKLLRPEERTALHAMKEAEQTLVLLRWGCEVVDLGYSKAAVPANAKQAALARLLALHRDMRKLAEVVELPVPFQYFQLLNLMLCVNIFAWAYIFGASSGFASPAIFVLCELTFMGLMELACALSNPFGQDAVDFPMNRWLSEFMQQAQMVLECRYKTEASWQSVVDGEGRLAFEFLHSRSFIAF